MSEVGDRLAEVRGRIQQACTAAGRSVSHVTLVAVSKRQPTERVLEAYEAGQRVFGENYVPGLEARRDELPEDARLHMIGHLQSNKAKRAAEISQLVETVDSIKLGRALAKAAPASGLDVLVQVNIDREESKSGVMPEAVGDLVKGLGAFEALRVRGLMAIPRAGQGRRGFSALRALRDELTETLGCTLPELSMGMSADFEDAILEGATIVRVGTQIFGARE